MLTDLTLYEALRVKRQAEEDAGQEMFLGIPNRWYEKPRWRCRNNHVSSMYLKSEGVGADLCLGCFQAVYMTFPEDRDGTPLEKQ